MTELMRLPRRIFHWAKVTRVGPFKITPLGTETAVRATGLSYSPVLGDLVVYIQIDDAISGSGPLVLVLGRVGSAFSGGQNVVTGDSSGSDSTSITSTVTGQGSSAATGNEAIAIGESAVATGNFGLALGNSAAASAQDAHAIGGGAQASGTFGIAVGSGATADADGAVAIGTDSGGTGATASSDTSVALGGRAEVEASCNYGIAIGRQALVRAANQALAIGNASYANADNATALGNLATAKAIGSVAIGDGALVNTGDDYGIAIGASSRASAANGLAIGDSAKAEDTKAVALGRLADASCPKGIAIGDSSIVVSNSDNSIAIGPDAATNTAKFGIAIGNAVVVSADGAVAVGADHTGAGATTSTQDDFMLGTALHHVQVPGRLNVARHTPASSADAQGSVGDITSDDSYVYVKTSVGWKRAALATF